MAGRTIAIGDIHGDVWHLERILAQLPVLDSEDTLVFLGDYLDRGPQSAQVVELVRKTLPGRTPARIVALRGNHEDAWLRVIDRGWPEFVLPPGNGCLACLRSYTAGDYPGENEGPGKHEADALIKGSFFPPDDVEWMRTLGFWYEDEHAIYVHAGLPWKDGRWLHPREVDEPLVLLWIRTEEFFIQYRGKMVICGHTTTDMLPPELSMYTPDDPTDLWQGENVLAIDTGCGKGGFLTAVELPAMVVYESR